MEHLPAQPFNPNYLPAREAHGDIILQGLLEAKDNLFRNGNSRNEQDQAAMARLNESIQRRELKLGIDPLEGPDYPSGE